MDAKHLDPDTYRRLRRGELDPASARAFADHLSRDCEVCEAFLAALPPDALDGAVDEALSQLAPEATGEGGNDLAWARIRRELAPTRSRPRFAAGRWAAMAAAVALVSLGGYQAVRVSRAPDTRWEGEKGRSAQAAPARLRFSVVRGAPGAPHLEQGRSGAVLPPEASLAFRAEASGPAFLTLVRVAGSDREVVWRGRAGGAGAIDVSEDGRPAAFPLRNLSGTQRFLLIASARPLGEEELPAVSRAGQAIAAGPARTPETVIDEVEVNVR